MQRAEFVQLMQLVSDELHKVQELVAISTKAFYQAKNIDMDIHFLTVIELIMQHLMYS